MLFAPKLFDDETNLRAARLIDGRDPDMLALPQEKDFDTNKIFIDE